MRMTADEITLCTALHRYLRYSMPACADISVIVNNLVAYGGLSVAEARHALKWGTDPYVFAESPRNQRCANGAGHAKCAFDSARSNWIEINLDDYNLFANGGGMGSTASSRTVPIVGVGLLHALCHWGNFKNGVSEKKEAGFEFERATYGKVIG